MMNDDMELVAEYAARQSEPAFETLVARHAGLVYSAALRHVRDAHLAGEITQTVFIILARKAGSLNSKTILPGWLYRTTRYAASAALKMQQRRERREQEAHMQAMIHESQNDPAWEQLSQLLDEAMTQLRDKDHDAIVLRYFQKQNLSEVGAALGMDEYAAQKRVSRALEKLRKFFTKRGVNSTSVIIAATISANSVQAAPAGLTATISATVIKGPAVAASTLALVKGTLNVMAWLKTKTLIVIGAGAVFTGAVVLTIHAQEEKNRQQEQAIRAEEQQIRTQELDTNLAPEQRQQLEARLDKLRAEQNQLRAAQNQLREQDPNPFTHPSAQVSPFTKVRFDGDKVLVTFQGEEFQLAAVNGVPTADLLAFCSQKYGPDKVQKRFAEDLVIVLSDSGHPANPDNTVSVTLVDSKTGETKTVNHATMTPENRQAVYNALPPAQQ